MLDTEGTEGTDIKSCSYCGESINISGYTYACKNCYEKESEGIINALKKDPKINQRIEIWARWLTGIIVILTVIMAWHWILG